MKTFLVTGGAGFVGRNLVKRLLETTSDRILIVDNLSTGIHPLLWLDVGNYKRNKGLEIFDNRLYFLNLDVRIFFKNLTEDKQYLKRKYGCPIVDFSTVFHFAAIVGGRAKIDGDPMMVALDLAIDAEFFYWAVRHKPERILYPSSSASYPVNLQSGEGAIGLQESFISFENGTIGMPDMTYGWSKLTGEYLAHIAAKHYKLSVVCVRPFSGYGETQDLTYPIPAIALRAANKDNPFEVWGTGLQGRDFVHIDDCIDCFLMALDNIHDGSAINIGSGKLTSFLEIIELMTGFAGYKPVIKALLDKPVGVHSRFSDITYVENRFNWKPKISLEEGMRRVYEAAAKNRKQRLEAGQVTV